ncbi:alpha-ketoacid dehydrogenase kinase [Xylona heveae TC161]|uniref:Protein-serine/threonine kinase n=1 Tax=Xylona heveae (strain CBS 132557 / TC161) TaxID=1328760 RepID=A0A165H9A7_XYLHT|nr:alpha-ketoacid dehydrogenase kinase [Xylona heveae TC161]KZF23166.1 alpha-ketoacid dehydrogenase kinase [Xylona heveae TC161]
MFLRQVLRATSRKEFSRLGTRVGRRRLFGSVPPPISPATQRWAYPSSAANVGHDEVSKLASQSLHPLSLSDLVKHGRPPLSAGSLFDSANFSSRLLPVRLAHRIQALRNLPFIVVSNPHISRIYNNYLHSLSTLLPYAERPIKTLEEEIRFTEIMADLVGTHSNTIPILARGFLECRKYISPSEVKRFLDEHLRARIGTRLIAEQHIALHYSSRLHGDPNVLPQKDESSSYIGVIDTALRPEKIIRNCESFVSEICELKYGVRPSLVINGEVDTTFTHVPVHMEYIITELLKNAFRATVEHGNEREPVEVTIAAAPAELLGKGNNQVWTTTDENSMHRELGVDAGSAATASSSSASAGNIQPLPLDHSTPCVTIRIRDRGGGIPPETLPNIWSYSFTTVSEDEPQGSGNPANSGTVGALQTISNAGPGSSLAGLGYGLPLGRAYAEYFGGGIALQSLWGWGTDVYLSLRGVGRIP